MKQFFEAYNKNQNLSPLVREVSWTNNLLILSKTTLLEEKEFYLRLSILRGIIAPFTNKT
jgi:predicted nuclease of restriction endonuclease-like (RecB) superfamily